MKEVFDKSHWSRKPMAGDTTLLEVAELIMQADILQELQDAAQGEEGNANFYNADTKYVRAHLYSYINETCRGVDLTNTVSISRYLQAAAAALRITNPASADYPRLMNRIFLRLHRDGCVEDYAEMVTAVMTPMLDSAASYAKAYQQLDDTIVKIGPDHPLWDYTTQRHNARVENTL